MSVRRFRVALMICVGMEQPLPIPGFAKLPVYRALARWQPETKQAATRRMMRMAKLNPGYRFAVESVEDE